jgi:hypothetical protein
MDLHPGGSRWCVEHSRRECTKQRSKGRGQCHGPAMKGMNACKNHVGMSKAAARAKGQATITAWQASVGTPTIDVSMTVLAVLQMTWLRLAAYSEMLRDQVEEDEEGEAGTGTGSAALIGYRWGAAGKDGKLYKQTEEVRAMVALEAAERDRIVRYAKIAHDMGISDRLTSLAERWGDVVVGRITLVLEGLQLTPEQSALVPGLLTRHLGSIDTDALGVEALQR